MARPLFRFGGLGPPGDGVQSSSTASSSSPAPGHPSPPRSLIAVGGSRDQFALRHGPGDAVPTPSSGTVIGPSSLREVVVEGLEPPGERHLVEGLGVVEPPVGLDDIVGRVVRFGQSRPARRSVRSRVWACQSRRGRAFRSRRWIGRLRRSLGRSGSSTRRSPRGSPRVATAVLVWPCSGHDSSSVTTSAERARGRKRWIVDGLGFGHVIDLRGTADAEGAAAVGARCDGDSPMAPP